MTFGGRGRAVLLAVALTVPSAGLAAGPAAVAHADVTAQGCSARAVVVVEPGPGPVTICFDGSVSGLEALQLAGANPVTYGFAGQGAAVCQLFGVGNPADQSSCLVGPGSQYWAYYRAGPGAGGWTYSRGGASTTTVTDGSVEGWRYGTGGAPGFVSFCAVVGCGPPPTEAPPVTQAPPAVTPSPPMVAPGTGTPTDSPTATVGGASASKADGKADSKSDSKAKDDSPSSGSDARKGADGATSTTAKGKDGRTTSAERKDRSDSAEVAAGGSGGGSDGGSPIGVIVAIAIVAVAVAAGLLVRRRRGGPAHG
ncbi:MAG TPA: hypothetical protein VGN51_20945 [Acidimicrobiia bacterium]|jgi:hypothetical protein